MTAHPLAELFPLMGASDFAALKHSLQTHGWIGAPVMLYEGAILDGRNRWQACEDLEMTAPVAEYEGTDPLGFVIAANLHRRHLNESQRAMVAARIATLLKGRPPTNGPIGPFTPTAIPAISQSAAADMLNVAVRTIKRARIVQDKGVQEVVAAVDAGELAVSAATAIAALPARAQRDIMRESDERERRRKVRDAKREARERRADERASAEPFTLVAPKGTVSRTSDAYYTVEQWGQLSATQRERIILEGFESKAGMNAQESTSIEWAKHSLNTVTGCLHNCPYCYAREIAERQHAAGSKTYPHGFAPVFWPARLAAPGCATFPTAEVRQDRSYANVFANSMSDLFGQWVPTEWIDATIDMARRNPRWQFLVLTKFPQRAAEFTFPANWWMGTTVDAQARVANAERAFAAIECAVKWLSVEPLLEPLVFTRLDLFQWMVIGGASASTKTPAWVPPLDWQVRLHQQARDAGLRIYYKTNAGLSDDLRVREFPGGTVASPRVLPKVFRYLKSM